MDLFPAPSTGGSLVDVSDRAGRLLGIVSTAQLPAALVGGRLDVNIGAPATLPVSLAAAVDVSDRAARLIGHVTIDSPLVAPAASGVANASGVRSSAFPMAYDTNAGTWGNWRQPPAGGAAIADGLGGPVGIPGVAMMVLDGFAGNWRPANGTSADGQTLFGPVALNLGWNGTTWDRIATSGDNADGVGTVTLAVQRALAELRLFNGASYDRARSTGDNADALATSTLGIQRSLAELAGFNGASWDRLRSGADNADGVAAVATGILRARSLLSFVNGAGTIDRAPGDTTAGLRVGLGRATLVQAGSAAANTALTLTLPAAGAGLFHYITHIFINRHATAALAGGATLAVTTTNLNGLTWRTGNQASITASTADGMVLTDADYTHPLRSQVANTASTIVMPVPGLAVLWTAWCAYYTGP